MAVSTNTVWEVRTDGDDNNGGGFVEGASGTDYSQQAATQLTLSDLATSGVGVTTLTSVTGGFTSAMVGNIIQIRSGTNLTTGWYEITAFTDTNTITLDRAPDDGVGGVSAATGNVGGALASIGQASNAVGAGAAFYGKGVWVRGGTYVLTSNTAHTSGGLFVFYSFSAKKFLKGYSTTRGDGGRPIIDFGAVTNATAIETSGSRVSYIMNFEFDGKTNATTYGIYGRSFPLVYNCHFRNLTSATFTSCFGAWIKCLSEDCSSHGFTGQERNIGSWARNNGGSGINSTNYQRSFLSTNNALIGVASSFGGEISDCISEGNLGDGFDGGSSRPHYWMSCLSYGNSGFGFDINSVSQPYNLQYCATGNNTGGRTDGNESADLNPVLLTVDPFIGSSNDHYTLNTTSGGGAVLRDVSITLDGALTFKPFMMWAG